MLYAHDDEIEMYSCDGAVDWNSGHKRNPSYLP